MNFFSKIAKLINGTPSNLDATNIDASVNSGNVAPTSNSEEPVIPEKDHSYRF